MTTLIPRSVWPRDALIVWLDAFVQSGCKSSLPQVISEPLWSWTRTNARFLGFHKGKDRALLANSKAKRHLTIHFKEYEKLIRSADQGSADAKRILARNRHSQSEVLAVCRDFLHDPLRLQLTAAAIRRYIDKQGLTKAEEAEMSASFEAMDTEESQNDLDPFSEAVEGRLLTVVHNRRERSRKLVLEKKKQFRKKWGALFCEACGFNFERVYGKRGFDFIECHHSTPVSEMSPDVPTKITDLQLLCANCHRMIHSGRPWLTVDSLKKILQRPA